MTRADNSQQAATPAHLDGPGPDAVPADPRALDDSRGLTLDDMIRLLEERLDSTIH